MDTRTLTAVLLGSSVLAALPAFAIESAATTTAGTTVSTTGNGRATTRLVQDFTTFAGSSANSSGLVNGLRHDTPITLTSTTAGHTTSTTFTPPTRPMGNGNVFISLALAEHQLAGLGITDPTPRQIRAALVGGTVVGPDGKPVRLQGVLTLRSEGMGWGRIAQTQGVKLGEVISSMKTAHTRVPNTFDGGHGEHAAFEGRHEFHDTDHGIRSGANAGGKVHAGTTRGVTTAAGPASRTHTGDADDRMVRSGTTANASGTPSGRGIVTAAGTGATGLHVATTGDHGGSHVATASGAAAGRGIVTAASSGGNAAAATSGIVRADGSGVTSAHAGNAFGHR